MTTSTIHRGPIRLGEPTGASSARSARIRRGGLRDVPAIARLATHPRSGAAEPARIIQARRLLLAHVAFEHGALWVEHDLEGALTRAATAIPAGGDAISRPVLNGILRAFQPPALYATRSEPDLDEDLAAIAANAPTWILAQMTATSDHQRGDDTALLATAVAWATRDQAEATLVVLAAATNERIQAERLNFRECQQTRPRGDWWLGLRRLPAPIPTRP